MSANSLYFINSDLALPKDLSELELIMFALKNVRMKEFATTDDGAFYTIDLQPIHYWNTQFISNVDSITRKCSDKGIVNKVVIPSHIMVHLWNDKTIAIYHDKLGRFTTQQEWLIFVNTVTFCVSI
jgi:hypothetical protein